MEIRFLDPYDDNNISICVKEKVSKPKEEFGKYKITLYEK